MDNESFNRLKVILTLAEGLQAMNVAHRLDILLVIRKFTDVFQGEFFWLGGVGGSEKVVTWEDFYMKEFLWKRIFHEGGRRFSQHYLKNDQKLNRKTCFFN